MDDQVHINKKNIAAIVDTLEAVKNEILALKSLVASTDKYINSLHMELEAIKRDQIVVRTMGVSKGPTVA